MKSTGRVVYESATDDEALDALSECARCEGSCWPSKARTRSSAPGYAERTPVRASYRVLGPRRQGHGILNGRFCAEPHATRATRISTAINAAAAKGNPALVGFLTAGFPTRRNFREKPRGGGRGIDVVEIGVPFSDPMADGSTIQRASFAALADGDAPWILEELRAFRGRSRRRCCS